MPNLSIQMKTNILIYCHPLQISVIKNEKFLAEYEKLHTYRYHSPSAKTLPNTLDLSNSKLLPDNVASQNIKILNLSKSKLTFPFPIDTTFLEELNINFCLTTDFPTIIGQIGTLKKLQAQNYVLNDMAWKTIEKLTQLEALDVSHFCNSSTIPPTDGWPRLPHLKKLTIGGEHVDIHTFYSLRVYTPTLEDLTFKFNLWSSAMTSIPPWVKEFTHLVSLQFFYRRHLKDNAVPETLMELPKLKRLRLPSTLISMSPRLLQWMTTKRFNRYPAYLCNDEFDRYCNLVS